MRFRAEQHLRRQRDIQAVRENGRRFDCGGFTLWYWRRPSVDTSPPPGVAEKSSRPHAVIAPVPGDLRRVCVVASTAAVGCAVQRARAKRRLREVFRLQQHRVPAGYDLMLVARNSLNRLEYGEIERKFVDACQRISPRPA